MKQAILTNWQTGERTEYLCDSIEIIEKKRVWQLSLYKKGVGWTYWYFPVSMYSVFVVTDKELTI